MSKHWFGVWLAGVLGLGIPMHAVAEFESASVSSARLALIIDDLGNHRASGLAAIDLPGQVTYAFLPHTPHARELAVQAHAKHRQVMLHLPMESHHGNRLGKGALTLAMPKAQLQRTLKQALASVPHVAGINNHMGSLLTRDPTAMRWLMSAIRGSNLFFIDSRTTDRTVAEKVARKNMVRSARRDVFLDNVADEEAIRRQWHRLIMLAKRSGGAIGIAHPHPETISVLAAELPRLQSQGVELVPASQMTSEGSILWHAYSSPLPRDAKNLKPSPSPIF